MDRRSAAVLFSRHAVCSKYRMESVNVFFQILWHQPCGQSIDGPEQGGFRPQRGAGKSKSIMNFLTIAFGWAPKASQAISFFMIRHISDIKSK
jgi:hypothetical protein